MAVTPSPRRSPSRLRSGAPALYDEFLKRDTRETGCSKLIGGDRLVGLCNINLELRCFSVALGTFLHKSPILYFTAAVTTRLHKEREAKWRAVAGRGNRELFMRIWAFTAFQIDGVAFLILSRHKLAASFFPNKGKQSRRQ